MTSDEAHYSKPQSKSTAVSFINHLKKRNAILILSLILAFLSLYAYSLYNRRTNNPFISQSSLSLRNYPLISIENKVLKEQNEEILLQNKRIMEEIDELKKKNEQLSAINKELTMDNIELQNSLKLAASVGIKPQNFTRFEGITRGDVERGEYAGKFLGTAYTPSIEECGNDKGITTSGIPVIPGISVAVDTKYWPIGTVFYIRGLGYAVAMDTGGAIKGKYRFDFAVFDKKFAHQLGVRYWDMYVVKYGEGKVNKIRF